MVSEVSINCWWASVARAMVAEDLAAQGVEETIIQKWLDELENTG